MSNLTKLWLAVFLILYTGTVLYVATRLSAPTQTVCSNSGTADVQLKTAIAALPHGGIVDARCYGASKVDILSEVAFSYITVLIDKVTQFHCGITDGSYCFHLRGQAAIKGDGVTGVAGGLGISLADGANVGAEIFSDGLANSIENIGLNGNANAHVAHGLLYDHGGGNVANISGVQTSGFGSPLMFNLVDSTGPISLINNYPDCSGIAGECTGIRLSNDNKGVGTNEITIQGGVVGHEGAGGNCSLIDIADMGGNNTGVSIEGLTLESAHSCAIGINMARCASCSVRTTGCSTGWYPAPGQAPGNACIKISGVSNQDVIETSTLYNSWTHLILNAAVSPNVDIAAPAQGIYLWQGFNLANSFRIDMGSGKSFVVDSNTVGKAGK